MMQQGKQVTYSQRIKVEAPPYDLADGRFEVRGAVLKAGFTAGMIVGAAAVVALAWWVRPEYGPPGAGHFILWTACLCLFIMSTGAGGTAAWLAVYGWWAYQRFLDKSRTAYLRAYIANDGQTITQQVRVQEINLKDPRDVITLIVYAYTTQSATIGKLRGPLHMPGKNGHLVRVGELTDHGAEQAAKLLEELKVLEAPTAQGAGRRLREAPLTELIAVAMRLWASGKRGEEA